jgi:hypothetical protein
MIPRLLLLIGIALVLVGCSSTGGNPRPSMTCVKGHDEILNALSVDATRTIFVCDEYAPIPPPSFGTPAEQPKDDCDFASGKPVPYDCVITPAPSTNLP